MPILCAFPSYPTAPSSTQRCVEGSQKLPIITAALPGKIMGPIIFNELHQRFQWACYHSNKDTLGSNTTFLSSKWLSVCEAKEHPPFFFPFQPCWIWKGQERQFIKKQAWLLAECSLPWPDVHMYFIESLSSAKWNLLYYDFLFLPRNMFPWKIASNRIRNTNQKKNKSKINK